MWKISIGWLPLGKNLRNRYSSYCVEIVKCEIWLFPKNRFLDFDCILLYQKTKYDILVFNFKVKIDKIKIKITNKTSLKENTYFFYDIIFIEKYNIFIL